MEIQTLTFTAPSGNTYTIREQNGQDEEILTNLREVNDYMNLSNFLQAIIMGSSRKKGKFTIEEVMAIPLLDRYALLFQSRIFSIGEVMEFSYTWPSGETFEYEQDLREYLLPYEELPDMDQAQLEKCFAEHPEAIPVYPKLVEGKEKDIEIVLGSGKRVKFDLLDGRGERYLAKLEDRFTRNSELIARNLCLEVEGRWDKVSNFSLFSVKDMNQIRRTVRSMDPIFNPLTDLENPQTNEKIKYPILSSTSFFFPEDVEMML